MADAKRPDTVMVFSGKSLETMIKVGGCGDWKLDKSRAARKRYLVAVRNLHAEWSEQGVPHGSAWLVGTISNVVPAPDDRWVVELSHYALLKPQIPNAWPGSRNPVAYVTLEELGIDPDQLEWVEFPKERAAVAPKAPAAAAPLTFDQAKAGLAVAMGISPEQIEITIRA